MLPHFVSLGFLFFCYAGVFVALKSVFWEIAMLGGNRTVRLSIDKNEFF